MSQTQVIEYPREYQAEQAKYEEILTRFISSSPSERVDIEQNIVETFRRSLEKSSLNDEDNKASETLADRVTAVSTILSTAVAASRAASEAGLDIREVVANAASNLVHHSTLWFGTALGLSTTLSVVVAIWNVKRVITTKENVQSVHDDFVKWDKRFMRALESAKAAVDRAVTDLCDYFVKRESLLRVQDGTKTGVLEYEMGMQMARCMAAVEHKLHKFKSLIDKAELTLAVIEKNVQVLEETATRQKRRGWMTVASGAVTFAAGFATFAVSGGVVPVAAAVLGVVVASAGGCIVYLSIQQLKRLKDLQADIDESKKILEDYKQSCAEFEEQIVAKLKQADDYITEAQKEAQLIEERAQREAVEAQLREAMAQNAALGVRLGSQSEDQRQIMGILAQHRLGKCLEIVLSMGIECVDDLELIDEDMLADVDCKMIVKKKLLRMAQELAGNK